MQHSIYVGSTYAVKINPDRTETRLQADGTGNISVSAGDVLIFKNYKGKGNVAVTEIVFRTSAEPLHAQFNDNCMYTYIVPAMSRQGISGMPVHKVKVLNDCTFAYDALA